MMHIYACVLAIFIVDCTFAVRNDVIKTGTTIGPNFLRKMAEGLGIYIRVLYKFMEKFYYILISTWTLP